MLGGNMHLVDGFFLSLKGFVWDDKSFWGVEQHQQMVVICCYNDASFPNL
jgi:hypothetical protein